MKTNEKKNTSAKKKLIPAVAMLTTSAVMLSTATYAWFTMSRDAEVTGLEMAATAGGGIEISLGEIGSGTLGSIKEPSMDDVSWKSTVKLGEYYGNIGKLQPASSVNGNNLFYADDNGIIAGGKVVQNGTDVKATATTDEVGLSVKESYDATGTNTTLVTAATPKNGRYLDIPMWIRTSKKDKTKVSCEVDIVDASNGESVKVNDGTELKKAVRVSVIPIGKANITTTANTNTLKITKAASYNSPTTNLNVYGLTFDSYSQKDGANEGISKAKTTETTYSELLDSISAKTVSVVTGDENHNDTAEIFTLDAANDDSYSVQSFVVRVWLEGESKFCNDATAAQDWNISLKFTGEDVTG